MDGAELTVVAFTSVSQTCLGAFHVLGAEIPSAGDLGHFCVPGPWYLPVTALVSVLLS